MATLQLRECRDQPEHNAWRLTALVLWGLALAGPFFLTTFHYAHGLPPAAVVLPLFVFCVTTAAMALLIAALRASTLARLSEDQERPVAPRPPEVLGIGFGAIALRALSMSSCADGVWLALAITAALGLAAFVRVTNRLRLATSRRCSVSHARGRRVIRPVFGVVSAPSAVLIRPDGYVAWVGDGTDHGLDDALTRWFGPPTAS